MLPLLLSSIDASDLPHPCQRLIDLRFPSSRSILDATYGHGKFWKGCTYNVFSFDGRLDRARDAVADFTALPLRDDSIDVIVFDPPFQPATINGIIGERFTKPVRGITDLKQLVQAGARDVWRACRLGCVIKVQDYIHAHKPVWMSLWIYEALGVEPDDFVTVRQPSKLKAKNWSRQLSVWRNHSTYWAYAKSARR